MVQPLVTLESKQFIRYVSTIVRFSKLYHLKFVSQTWHSAASLLFSDIILHLNHDKSVATFKKDLAWLFVARYATAVIDVRTLIGKCSRLNFSAHRSYDSNLDRLHQQRHHDAFANPVRLCADRLLNTGYGVRVRREGDDL